MFNIKAHCKKIEKSFFIAIDEAPLSAALMLGNLYLCLPIANKDDIQFLNKSLKFVKKNIKFEHINRLWDIVTKPSHQRLRSDSNKKSLDILKRQLICDFDCVQHINPKLLLELRNDIQLYRVVLIAIIRKHLFENHENDPFAQEKGKKKFDYNLLMQGGASQNYLYLSRYIKDCSSLPVKDIAILGEENSIIAKNILKDLTGSPYLFDVGAQFAQYHKDIRQHIAKNWKGYLDTHPLSPRLKKTISIQLKDLKSKYPEFSIVNIQSRVKRNYQSTQGDLPLSKISNLYHLLGISGVSWGSYIFSKYTMMQGVVPAGASLSAAFVASPHLFFLPASVALLGTAAYVKSENNIKKKMDHDVENTELNKHVCRIKNTAKRI